MYTAHSSNKFQEAMPSKLANNSRIHLLESNNKLARQELLNLKHISLSKKYLA
jgi:hypothetical protein